MLPHDSCYLWYKAKAFLQYYFLPIVSFFTVVLPLSIFRSRPRPEMKLKFKIVFGNSSSWFLFLKEERERKVSVSNVNASRSSTGKTALSLRYNHIALA